ncbi:MAG: hypothetical protein AB7V46_24770 [Thermomicrobiales bacterium]
MSFNRLSRFSGGIQCMGSALGAALIACAVIFPSAGSAASEDRNLTACAPVVSADQRLRMERWAIDEHCARPVRTRVIDRYLGFTCSKELDAAVRCRSYLPTFESRALERGNIQRCFDAALTAVEGEYAVSRVREWVTSVSGKCEWDPHLLAVETDLENAQVCIDELCVATSQLSIVGRLRLLRTILKAFNQPT